MVVRYQAALLGARGVVATLDSPGGAPLNKIAAVQGVRLQLLPDLLPTGCGHWEESPAAPGPEVEVITTSCPRCSRALWYSSPSWRLL